MADDVQKKVDESWKERVEQEKQQPDQPQPTVAGAGGPPSGPQAPPQPQRSGSMEAEGLPEARFDLFVSGLVMEALIAMGDMPHPTTRKQSANLPHAKYLVDLLGILQEKTKGNVSVDEEKLLADALYQLRMRYLSKAGGS